MWSAARTKNRAHVHSNKGFMEGGRRIQDHITAEGLAAIVVLLTQETGRGAEPINRIGSLADAHHATLQRAYYTRMHGYTQARAAATTAQEHDKAMAPV